MSEKPHIGGGKAFESFIGNAQHEARIERRESPNEHALRLISEAQEVLDAGIQSSEEATALIAKLDIASEATDDFAVKAAAKVLQTDIKSRYPGRDE